MTSSNYYSVIILIFQLFIPYDEFQLRFHTTAMDRNSVEGVNESSRYSRLMTAKASYSWQNQTVEKENSQRLDFCEDERNLNRHMLWNWALSKNPPQWDDPSWVAGQPGKNLRFCHNRPSWFNDQDLLHWPHNNYIFQCILLGTTVVGNDQGRSITLTT